MKAGFRSKYIDPRNCAEKMARSLKEFMDEYCANHRRYNAPYTSLVTSSMMGKSRLMKETSSFIPVVYICTRSGSAQTAYPLRTPIIADWFDRGIAYLYQPNLGDEVLQADRLCILSTLKYSVFLLALTQHLDRILNDEDVVRRFSVQQQAAEGSYRWMWDYFAEPTDKSELERFWKRVIASVQDVVAPYRNANAARDYYSARYESDLTIAWKSLANSFGRLYKTEESLTIILMCDEARRLCQLSAADGSAIDNYSHDDFRVHDETDQLDDAGPLEGLVPFSIFRALRRALRFLSIPEQDMPRIFGEFTDTSSRLTNFQPSQSEEQSMRLLSLPHMGPRHFPPIFSFTSIDAWSRIHNRCVADESVGDPERLVMFGRAGWRSLYNYFHKRKDEKTGQIVQITHASEIGVARGKLLNYRFRVGEVDNPWVSHGPLSRKSLLILVSALAPRIALSANPDSVEASEMIASHMAVLMRTDTDRHFLRIVYPSEPLLAEASASITTMYGWGRPLQALHLYVQSGIVDAGFRGELLTKIVCLMAAEDAMKSKPGYNDKKEWKFSRPVSVAQFLDKLVRFESDEPTDRGHTRQNITSISDYITTYSKIDLVDLAKFLGGTVFFNHFIRVRYTISIQTLVQAWNRGAAIMCKSYNPRFDHVIPVMLDGADSSKFGNLYGEWNDEQLEEARRSVSYILIDSKNYARRRNWTNYVPEITPEPTKRSKDNETLDGDDPVDSNTMQIDECAADIAHNLLHSQPSNNVYMALLQDFGPRCTTHGGHPEPALILEPMIFGCNTRSTSHCDTKQLRLILKGIGEDTYECLTDRARGQVTDKDVSRAAAEPAAVRKYLQEIRDSDVDYLEENNEYGGLAQHYLECVLESAPLASDLDGGWKGIWEATHRNMSGANPDDDFDSDIANDAGSASTTTPTTPTSEELSG
jgi:hypothetical protein